MKQSINHVLTANWQMSYVCLSVLICEDRHFEFLLSLSTQWLLGTTSMLGAYWLTLMKIIPSLLKFGIK